MQKLAAALVAARKEMEDPRLSGSNPHFKSKFVPRDEALDSVMPALLKHGLMLVQSPIKDEFGVGVNSLLVHESGETLDLGPFTVRPTKDDPQGAVAATTYASRCAIMLIHAVAGDNDDDGNSVSTPQKRENAPQRTKTTKVVQPTAEEGKNALRALWGLARERGIEDVKLKAWVFKETSKAVADLTDAEAAALVEPMKSAYGLA